MNDLLIFLLPCFICCYDLNMGHITVAILTAVTYRNRRPKQQ